MTDNDRTELARIIHKAECGCSLNEDCSTEPDPLYPMVADAVLASDWLARRDAVSGSAVRELATARTDALHEAATQVEAYLRKEHAPPTWWHVYDILHTLAGCTWDDEAGEDGWGEYSCVAGASQIAARASVDASFVPVSVESGPRN